MNSMNDNIPEPGDPVLVQTIVTQLKSQGLYDEFRKECVSDVDTKPAYHNLRHRVNTYVHSYLSKHRWSADLNKNLVREKIRKYVCDCPFLERGIERVVEQVVNPKIHPVLVPKVEEAVHKFVGFKRDIDEEEYQEETAVVDYHSAFNNQSTPSFANRISTTTRNIPENHSSLLKGTTNEPSDNKNQFPELVCQMAENKNEKTVEEEDDDISPPFEPHRLSDSTYSDSDSICKNIPRKIDSSEKKDNSSPTLVTENIKNKNGEICNKENGFVVKESSSNKSNGKNHSDGTSETASKIISTDGNAETSTEDDKGKSEKHKNRKDGSKHTQIDKHKRRSKHSSRESSRHRKDDKKETADKDHKHEKDRKSEKCRKNEKESKSHSDGHRSHSSRHNKHHRDDKEKQSNHKSEYHKHTTHHKSGSHHKSDSSKDKRRSKSLDGPRDYKKKKTDSVAEINNTDLESKNQDNNYAMEIFDKCDSAKSQHAKLKDKKYSKEKHHKRENYKECCKEDKKDKNHRRSPENDNNGSSSSHMPDTEPSGYIETSTGNSSTTGRKQSSSSSSSHKSKNNSNADVLQLGKNDGFPIPRKPKIAANIYEVKKIIRLRKQYALLHPNNTTRDKPSISVDNENNSEENLKDRLTLKSEDGSNIIDKRESNNDKSTEEVIKVVKEGNYEYSAVKLNAIHENSQENVKDRFALKSEDGLNITDNCESSNGESIEEEMKADNYEHLVVKSNAIHENSQENLNDRLALKSEDCLSIIDKHESNNDESTEEEMKTDNYEYSTVKSNAINENSQENLKDHLLLKSEDGLNITDNRKSYNDETTEKGMKADNYECSTLKSNAINDNTVCFNETIELIRKKSSVFQKNNLDVQIKANNYNKLATKLKDIKKTDMPSIMRIDKLLKNKSLVFTEDKNNLEKGIKTNKYIDLTAKLNRVNKHIAPSDQSDEFLRKKSLEGNKNTLKNGMKAGNCENLILRVNTANKHILSSDQLNELFKVNELFKKISLVCSNSSNNPLQRANANNYDGLVVKSITINKRFIPADKTNELLTNQSIKLSKNKINLKNPCNTICDNDISKVPNLNKSNSSSLCATIPNASIAKCTDDNYYRSLFNISNIYPIVLLPNIAKNGYVAKLGRVKDNSIYDNVNCMLNDLLNDNEIQIRTANGTISVTRIHKNIRSKNNTHWKMTDASLKTNKICDLISYENKTSVSKADGSPKLNIKYFNNIGNIVMSDMDDNEKLNPIKTGEIASNGKITNNNSVGIGKHSPNKNQTQQRSGCYNKKSKIKHLETKNGYVDLIKSGNDDVVKRRITIKNPPNCITNKITYNNNNNNNTTMDPTCDSEYADIREYGLVSNDTDRSNGVIRFETKSDKCKLQDKGCNFNTSRISDLMPDKANEIIIDADKRYTGELNLNNNYLEKNGIPLTDVKVSLIKIDTVYNIKNGSSPISNLQSNKANKSNHNINYADLEKLENNTNLYNVDHIDNKYNQITGAVTSKIDNVFSQNCINENKTFSKQFKFDKFENSSSNKCVKGKSTKKFELEKLKNSCNKKFGGKPDICNNVKYIDKECNKSVETGKMVTSDSILKCKDRSDPRLVNELLSGEINFKKLYQAKHTLMKDKKCKMLLDQLNNFIGYNIAEHTLSFSRNLDSQFNFDNFETADDKENNCGSVDFVDILTNTNGIEQSTVSVKNNIESHVLADFVNVNCSTEILSEKETESTIKDDTKQNSNNKVDTEIDDINIGDDVSSKKEEICIALKLETKHELKRQGKFKPSQKPKIIICEQSGAGTSNDYTGEIECVNKASDETDQRCNSPTNNQTSHRRAQLSPTQCNALYQTTDKDYSNQNRNNNSKTNIKVGDEINYTKDDDNCTNEEKILTSHSVKVDTRQMLKRQGIPGGDTRKKIKLEDDVISKQINADIFSKHTNGTNSVSKVFDEPILKCSYANVTNHETNEASPNTAEKSPVECNVTHKTSDEADKINIEICGINKSIADRDGNIYTNKEKDVTCYPLNSDKKRKLDMQGTCTVRESKLVKFENFGIYKPKDVVYDEMESASKVCEETNQTCGHLNVTNSEISRVCPKRDNSDLIGAIHLTTITDIYNNNAVLKENNTCKVTDDKLSFSRNLDANKYTLPNLKSAADNGNNKIIIKSIKLKKNTDKIEKNCIQEESKNELNFSSQKWHVVENSKKKMSRNDKYVNGNADFVSEALMNKNGIRICVRNKNIPHSCGFVPQKQETCEVISNPVSETLSIQKESCKEGLSHTSTLPENKKIEPIILKSLSKYRAAIVKKEENDSDISTSIKYENITNQTDRDGEYKAKNCTQYTDSEESFLYFVPYKLEYYEETRDKFKRNIKFWNGKKHKLNLHMKQKQFSNINDIYEAIENIEKNVQFLNESGRGYLHFWYNNLDALNNYYLEKQLKFDQRNSQVLTNPFNFMYLPSHNGELPKKHNNNICFKMKSESENNTVPNKVIIRTIKKNKPNNKWLIDKVENKNFEVIDGVRQPEKIKIYKAKKIQI